MGWVFELAAEFGDDFAQASKFERFFDGVRLTQPSLAIAITIRAGTETGENGRWWVRAIPTGLEVIPATEQEELRRVSAVGSLLYDMLRRTSGYRFAMVGVEAFDFILAEQLSMIINVPAASGLVFSDEIWVSEGKPNAYVPFSDGYRWRPYAGEKQLGGIVGLWAK